MAIKLKVGAGAAGIRNVFARMPFRFGVVTMRAAPLLTLAVGVGTLLVLLGIERFFPRLPAPIVAVVAAILAMSLFGLQTLGVESIGEVPRGLPSFVAPDPSRFPVAPSAPGRVQRLKALGNGIVPEAAYWVFQAIAAAERNRE